MRIIGNGRKKGGKDGGCAFIHLQGTACVGASKAAVWLRVAGYLLLEQVLEPLDEARQHPLNEGFFAGKMIQETSSTHCPSYIGYPFEKTAFEERRSCFQTSSLYTDFSCSQHRSSVHRP